MELKPLSGKKNNHLFISEHSSKRGEEQLHVSLELNQCVVEIMAKPYSGES